MEIQMKRDRLPPAKQQQDRREIDLQALFIGYCIFCMLEPNRFSFASVTFEVRAHNWLIEYHRGNT